MQREQKKIVMGEKIQEWLNMKKEQVYNHCFKLIIMLTLAKFGQFPFATSQLDLCETSVL